jgi:hypothetical protein
MAKWTEQRMARRIADMWAWAENHGESVCGMCPGFQFDYCEDILLSAAIVDGYWLSLSLNCCNLCRTVMASQNCCPCFYYGVKNIKVALKERLALYGYEVVDE